MTNIKIYSVITRKIIFMFVLFFGFLHFQLFCQVIDWEQTFGGEGIDIGLCVQPAIDGGYITCGWTTSFEEDNIDIYLIKTDDQGNEIWSKTIGGSGSESARTIHQTADSCYIMIGSTTSFGSGAFDVYLIKLDVNGNEIWTQCYGGIAHDRGYCGQQTSDGGYIIVGHTESFGSGYWDIYLIKTDENGNEIWSNTFGGSDAEYGYFVRQTNDGGFIITGYTTSFGAGSKDVYLIKTDHLGNETWSKTFGGIYGDLGSSVLQTSDGGYIIAGYMAPYVASYFFLLKTDENGNEIWSHTFGGNCCWSVNQTSDGGYILCGQRGSYNMDIFVVKTDEDGNEIWSQAYGGSGYDAGCYIFETSDAGYILSGTYDFDLYLLKLLPENVSIEDTELIGGSASLFLKPAYPNPFNPATTISFFTAENAESAEIIIYNIKGQLVKTLTPMTNDQSASWRMTNVVWDGKDENGWQLSNGIYFYCLKIGNRIIDTKKCVILR
ncbi:MAG: T9SS type A sorting domain-containing protein [Candidatus Cloacimonetes bacterium]|nr:T9SS type A sorting domain-containing protein [Candidatus Cloacimonadota bacterium]